MPPEERVWRVRDVLQWSRERFERAALGTPRLDAEVLLAHALRCDRVSLYTGFEKPLRTEELARYREHLRRRLRREPVSYITGQREFWSIPLRVDRRVLVPRPSTETLVEETLARLPRDSDTQRGCDVGTGSGAIAIALLRERPDLEMVGTDTSAGALEVAASNAASADVAARFVLRRGDLFTALDREDGEMGPPFDFIVSNPPYVPTAELAALDAEIRDHEPSCALDGGIDGLRVVARLLKEAGRYLVPGGLLLVEIGAGQHDSVQTLARAQPWAADSDACVVRDPAGTDRVLIMTRNAGAIDG